MSYGSFGTNEGVVPKAAELISKVVPSGLALATSAVPICPVALALFSTTTLRLSTLPNSMAKGRAKASTPPPAAKGTTKRMVRSGSSWEIANEVVNKTDGPATKPAKVWRRFIMGTFLV